MRAGTDLSSRRTRADVLRERQAAHARQRHECRCGRVIYGNAYANHRRACREAVGVEADLFAGAAPAEAERPRR